MKTVFGGQLDRVFMNDVAIAAGLKREDATYLDKIATQRDADKQYREMASTVAALSEQILVLPYILLDPNLNNASAHSSNTDHVKSPMGPVRADVQFDQRTEDALTLTKACAWIAGLAKTTNDILGEIDTEGAWIGGHHSLKHLHEEYGQPHVYLTGLLLQATLAWELEAVLVLAECDRSILADLGAIVARNRWPYPFPIPDLRHLEPPLHEDKIGHVLNLRPTNLAAFDTNRQQPWVLAYVSAVSHAIQHSEAGNTKTALDDARRSLSGNGSSPRDESANIMLATSHVPIFTNEGTIHPGHKTGKDDWSRRRFPSRDLQVVVLWID